MHSCSPPPPPTAVGTRAYVLALRLDVEYQANSIMRKSKYSFIHFNTPKQNSFTQLHSFSIISPTETSI